MFTQPIAMKCNQQQFDDIKGELKELGYTFSLMINKWEQFPYLVSNDTGCNGRITNSNKNDCYSRMFFKEWNKDLFLALAAMTDDPDGIKGEWWKCTTSDNMGTQFIKDKLYKSMKSILNDSPFICETKSEDGFSNNHKYFQKPTAPEIINHFTSTTMSENFKITVEQFKQLHSIACSDWKNKLQGWVKGTDVFTTHVSLTNEQVSEIFKAATTLQLQTVKEVFPGFTKEAKNYKEVADALFMSKAAYRLSNSGGVDVVSCVNCPDWINLSTSKEQLESLLALNQLANVAKYLNGDWKASFKNSMGKHFLYVEGPIISVTRCFDSNTGAICFKTEELAKKSIEILGEETIRKALTIGCH